MIFPHFSSDIMQRVTSAPSPLLIVSWYFRYRYFLATWTYSLTTHFSLEALCHSALVFPFDFLQCPSLSPFSNLFLRNRQSQGWIGDRHLLSPLRSQATGFHRLLSDNNSGATVGDPKTEVTILKRPMRQQFYQI